MDKKLVTRGLFLDFSKEFDTINHDILLLKLYRYMVYVEILSDGLKTTYKFVIWFLEYIDLVYFSLTTFIHVFLFFLFLLFCSLLSFCFFGLIHVNIVTLAHLNSLNFLLSLFLTLFRKVLIQIKIPM